MSRQETAGRVSNKWQMRKRDRRMSSRGEIKKSPLSSRGGLIKVRDNKRQEGWPGTREGRTAGSRTRGLKYRQAGTMEFYRGTSGLFLSPFPLPFSLFLSFASRFRSNSAYRTRKQIKLRVKRKIEILRFFHGITRGNDNGKVLRACQLSRKIINSTKT